MMYNEQRKVYSTPSQEQSEALAPLEEDDDPLALVDVDLGPSVKRAQASVQAEPTTAQCVPLQQDRSELGVPRRVRVRDRFPSLGGRNGHVENVVDRLK